MTIGKGLKVQKPARLMPRVRKGANAIKSKLSAAKKKNAGKTLNLMGSTRRQERRTKPGIRGRRNRA